MDLCGDWRGATVTPDLEREGADPELDDSGWRSVPVPGHWGQVPELVGTAGPVLYRRRFAWPPDPADRATGHGAATRHWLRFDGVLSEAEVWLDGTHLGDLSLYFAPQRFDVTPHLRSRTTAPNAGGSREHVLAVEVACPPPGPGAKKTLTGSLQSGPLAPAGSPGGIWGEVGIDTTGSVAIVTSRLLCLDASPERATLQLRVVLDAAVAGPVRIDTSVVGPDGSTAGGSADRELASGENHLEWTTAITTPRLWWPAGLGDQPLYDVSVTVRPAPSSPADDQAPAVSDRRQWRTGLRTVKVDGLQWSVNGERLFAKGIVVGPHDRFLASVDPEQLVSDVGTARDAGLDLIRVHGHIARPELYRAADEAGVLVWQDLPLVGSYTTRSRGPARHLARAVVDQLGHHPSIAAWCGHDEPNGPPLPVPDPGAGAETATATSRRLGRHLLPSWNRSVLDPLVRRELRAADPSRSVIARSGSLPNLFDVAGSDSHLWLGWRAGRGEDLGDVIRRWPRLGAFVGTIGSQSVGQGEHGPAGPDWHGAERGSFERYLPPDAYPDATSWAEATRLYQAELIRTQIETARRLKYRPTGGFCVVSLFDHDQAGGFGVLDRQRRAKPALTALVDACRPVVVVGDLPPPVVTPGEELTLAVHAVSDLRQDLGPVRVAARAELGAWSAERIWEGWLAADSVSYVGNFCFTVPEATGALVIDLELEAGEGLATNRYRTVIIPPSEAMDPAPTT